MSFFNEIIIKLGLSPENCIGGDKVSLYDGAGLFVEGHRGVSFYSKEQVVIRLKKYHLTVNGANLRIIEINNSELYISGKIENISRGL